MTPLQHPPLQQVSLQQVSLQQVLEIPNFFVDPDKIRDIALNHLSMQPCTAFERWPGLRSAPLHESFPELFQLLWDELFRIFGIPPSTKGEMRAYFQLCSERDGDSWIHQDSSESHVAIIYLTPNPPPNSGTILYSPVEVGFNPYAMPAPGNYVKKKVLTNEYNKFVSYDSREFHKSDEYFGSTKEDSRLFLIIFLSIEPN